MMPDIPAFEHLDYFGQSVLKGLLSSLAKALADPQEWHMLGAGMKVLEACIGVVGSDALVVVNHISAFESSLANVAAAERVEPDPAIEEKRRIAESLGPAVERHAHSTANARESLQNNKIQYEGCLGRIAEIDAEIERLQAEKIAVSFEAARLESVVTQGQITVTRLESEGEAARKQLEDLTAELQHVPDPAEVLSAAKSAMETARVAVIRLISGCLEKL